MRCDRFSEAEEVLTKAHAGLSERIDVPAQYQLNVLKHLVRLYQQWERPEQASKYQDMLEAARSEQ